LLFIFSFLFSLQSLLFFCLLQSPSAGTLHRLLRAVLPSVRPPSDVEFTLDVDPCHML